MDWKEIKIKVATGDTEKASAIANMTIPYGIYIEDYSDLEQGALEIAHIDLIDEELIKSDREHSIIHIYFPEDANLFEATEYLTERLTLAEVEFELDKTDISEEEWENNWKQFFKVTEIGERLTVRPSWEEYDNKEGRVVLSIDPGAAFGTGTHATTSMCLKVLEKIVAQDMTLLDIGSGSGILSIAAALLGAKTVGVDIDSVAVKVAKENAVLNNVESKTQYIVGNLDELITDTFDIVVANIVADVIIHLSSGVKKLINPEGYFLCSGIIDLRQQEVEDALKSNGLEIIEKITDNNWVAYLTKAK